MEISAQPLSFPKLPIPRPPSSSSSSPLFFHLRPSAPFLGGVNNSPIKLQCIRSKATHGRSLVAINASGSQATATDNAERWLLEPVGDGDSRHLGFKVSMPGAFEIASNEVTVGRLPEKADMVIPVATVSGLHARIKKKEGSLLVMDLDSTNGTFIDDKRLRPGVAATASSGNCITFGDIHLAMFRVSKIGNVETAGDSEDSEAKPEAEESEESIDNPETTTS
ncbi:uncharacterized protein LOC127800569 [Diospyros lotus]|uniref:uncharacterized protein LOC127800569 n=1 Tax=Diospyros lotus TaxID=55363 RepID=UPI00225B7008|nr:uncharacterized protein LOC127800569 [Diospyros lotus]